MGYASIIALVACQPTTVSGEVTPVPTPHPIPLPAVLQEGLLPLQLGLVEPLCIKVWCGLC
jgi:hypothetical protein